MYDVIVIGNDLSSLIAAAVMSHHGSKTVLLSESDAKQASSDFGYTFNIDPFPLTGFGPAQTCARLFEDLRIDAAAFSGLQLLNSGLQIVLPHHRVDCFHRREELLNDMEREFPDYADEIRELYLSVVKISNLVAQKIIEMPRMNPTNRNRFLSLLKDIPVILKERYSLSKRFKSVAKNPSLNRVFEAESAILSNLSNNINSPFSISSAYALSLPLRGLYHHVGGKEALTGILKSTFEASGGHSIQNCSVMRLELGKEINVHVSVAEKLSQIRGRYLIASTKWQKLSLLLLSGRRFRRLERRLKLAKSAYYPFTLHMGVLERCIPEKMATYVAIIIDQTRPVMDDNLVFVEISSSNCIERAPAGRRALSATFFLKESPLVLTDDELKEAFHFVLSALEKFLPFLRENLDYLNIAKSIELSRRSQELINQKYSMKSDSFLGLSDISNKTPRSNVILTGGMLSPYLGFEGEVITGLNAANSVVAKEKHRHG
jgi:phytoene dehydrogenase-like protein